MYILIEDDQTLEYLSAAGKWTKDPQAGLAFPDRKAAFNAAKLERIEKFNIVAYIRTTRQFLNLDHGRGKGAPETSGGETGPTA